MKTLIDVPDDLMQPLQILALKANTDLKNFIQDLLIDRVKIEESEAVDLTANKWNDFKRIKLNVPDVLTCQVIDDVLMIDGSTDKLKDFRAKIGRAKLLTRAKKWSSLPMLLIQRGF
jgi:hypothetical protein